MKLNGTESIKEAWSSAHKEFVIDYYRGHKKELEDEIARLDSNLKALKELRDSIKGL